MFKVEEVHWKIVIFSFEISQSRFYWTIGLLLVDDGFTLAVIELGCKPAPNKKGHN